MRNTPWLFVCLLVFMSALFFSSKAYSCSLAIHNWKLAYFKRFKLDAPLFPMAEISEISSQLQRNPVQKVIWLAKHTFFTKLAVELIKKFDLPVAKIPWELCEKKASVLSIAHDSLGAEKPPLILGSDKVVLKIALFSDKNSNYNCYQLVFMQENRIRAVIASSVSPWAQESKGKTWLSLIFYKYPIPGNILSLAVFPYKSRRKIIYEDHDYVEKLLQDKKLKRRADLELDPFSTDFPPLPE